MVFFYTFKITHNIWSDPYSGYWTANVCIYTFLNICCFVFLEYVHVYIYNFKFASSQYPWNWLMWIVNFCLYFCLFFGLQIKFCEFFYTFYCIYNLKHWLCALCLWSMTILRCNILISLLYVTVFKSFQVFHSSKLISFVWFWLFSFHVISTLKIYLWFSLVFKCDACWSIFFISVKMIKDFCDGMPKKRKRIKLISIFSFFFDAWLECFSFLNSFSIKEVYFHLFLK